VPTRRVFLLSPARCDGQRAKLLTDAEARSPLATQLREPQGTPLGDVFSFLSSLYFRGKLTYARVFANPSLGAEPALVITADRGLMSPDVHVRRDDLLAFSRVDIAGGDERYLAPLRRDATALARTIDDSTLVVLLGSVATGKYVDTLLDTFGNRLVFPPAFVGRGDMSRGGLLLRHAREGRELDYVPVAGAVRHGQRPPKLEPQRKPRIRPDERPNKKPQMNADPTTDRPAPTVGPSKDFPEAGRDVIDRGD
jgi:hypothetical protein